MTTFFFFEIMLNSIESEIFVTKQRVFKRQFRDNYHLYISNYVLSLV